MQYEIDYLAVGEGEKSGDAIALRFGDILNGTQSVVVIDGGTKESGKNLVKHINNYYGTNKVDVVICTHPDADHASGLTEILENMQVDYLLMHQPWNHTDNIKNMFKDSRLSSTGLENKLTDALQHAYALEKLAETKKIKIVEPFAGVTGFNNSMRVLGPTIDYYRTLLCNFDCTPIPKPALTLPDLIKRAGTEVVKWVDDHLHINLLDDIDRTSPQNNSSSVILFTLGDHKILFTGDAGISGLCAAADYAESLGVSLADLTFLHVPHHGSRRNAGKAAFQRIKATTAYISAAKDSSKHPSEKVMNALYKNGTAVHKTCGRHIYSFHGLQLRQGWSQLTPEAFYPRVKE